MRFFERGGAQGSSVGAAVLVACTTMAMGCGDSPSAQASAAPATTSAAPAATAAPAAPGGNKTGGKSCADYGGVGDGTFEKMCMLPKIATEAKWTGTFEKSMFGTEEAVIEVKNLTDHALNWATLSVWCYDKDGKLLEFTSLEKSGKPFKRFYRTGSGVLNDKSGKPVAPGATVRVLGLQKPMLPEGLDTCVAETTAWGWDDKDSKMFFGVDRPPSTNIENRPKAGF